MKKLLVLVSLLGLGMACKLVTPAGDNNVTLSDCYRVSFLGVSQSTERISTWSYRVEELACAQDLSNWMLELPACATVVDASPPPWEIVHPDPNYQLDGIKWETGAGFRSGEFSMVLTGELMPGMVRVGVKGPDVTIGMITGPICKLTTLTPNTSTPDTLTETNTPEANTPTPTMTVTSTLVPTETPPAQPPANSGPILITDNDQTLTFTCQGNAVEVRGNANVITLLGACSSITIRGNGNQVYWQAGSPIITDTGNENIIRQQ